MGVHILFKCAPQYLSIHCTYIGGMSIGDALAQVPAGPMNIAI